MVDGRWSLDNIDQKLGDEASTLFWKDPWTDGIPLNVRFSRLFNLVENKLASITKMNKLGWGGNGEAWKWRRRLFAWDEELVVSVLSGQPQLFCNWI